MDSSIKSCNGVAEAGNAALVELPAITGEAVFRQSGEEIPTEAFMGSAENGGPEEPRSFYVLKRSRSPLREKTDQWRILRH